MGVCWYCHWGWAKPVADVYKKYLDLLEGDDMLLGYQQGHIVWSDENFETENIQYCIDHADEHWNQEEVTKEQHDLITESLRELLLIPEEIRCCCPEDYPDDNDADPENYPPPVGLEMVKKY
jgi:hypothetical protein